MIGKIIRSTSGIFWALLQSTHDGIFKNSVSNDILNTEQLFIIAQTTHSLSGSKQVSSACASKSSISYATIKFLTISFTGGKIKWKGEDLPDI